MKTKTITILAGVLFVFLILLTGCRETNSEKSDFIPTVTPRTKLLAADIENLEIYHAFVPVEPTPAPGGEIFPTATPDANKTKNWPTPIPVGTSSNGEQATVLNIPDDQVNILLMGSDLRPYGGSYRTDVMMLVSINLDSQEVNLISFPRDLYVYLPGLYSDRINTAMPRGGFDLVADMMEYNFGVRPDYYGLIHLWHFRDFVDAIGGIDVNVGRTHTDQRTGYESYTVFKGVVHMDGDTTMWYIRSRYSTSDFDRTRRAQEVIQAVVRRVLSFNVAVKFISLYQQFNGIIETNLPLSKITPFLPVADELMGGEFGRYAVSSNHVTNWMTPSGAAVLLPNDLAIRQMLKTVLKAE